MHVSLFFVFGLATLINPCDAKAKAIRSELTKLSGCWIGVSRVDKEGLVEYPPGTVVLMMIDGPGKDAQVRPNFDVDPTKSPKEFCLRCTDRNLLGVYKFDGKRLTLCSFESDEESSSKRPAKFAVKQGSGAVIEVFERLKPDSQQR